MRRIVMAVLLLTSMSASAGDVYDCADTASNGFQWKDGRYHPALFDAQEFKMELDGMRVQLTDITGWADGTYECERIWGFIDRHYLTCRRNAAIFNYNKKTGHYTRTDSVGWLRDDPSAARNSMEISYGTCEKLD